MKHPKFCGPVVRRREVERGLLAAAVPEVLSLVGLQHADDGVGDPEAAVSFEVLEEDDRRLVAALVRVVVVRADRRSDDRMVEVPLVRPVAGRSRARLRRHWVRGRVASVVEVAEVLAWAAQGCDVKSQLLRLISPTVRFHSFQLILGRVIIFLQVLARWMRFLIDPFDRQRPKLKYT